MSLASIDTPYWAVEDRVERLKVLWREGRSASQIARELGGGATRSAIIGKVHRLGISERPNASPPNTRKDYLAKPRQPRATYLKLAGNTPIFHEPPAITPPRYTPPAREEGPGLRDIMTISQFGECRWPIGDPREPDFTLCGAQAPDDRAYCPHHAAIAYQPPKAGQQPNQMMRALRRAIG